MPPSRSPFRSYAALRNALRERPLLAYLTAFALFVLALVTRFALDSALPSGFPYLTFFPAVLISTFLCGTGPGILAATLSGFAAWFFFLPPFNTFSIGGQSALALAFFIFIVTVDIAVIDRMMRALEDADAARRAALGFAEQRDALFKELQHRVGNNLNMVSAMLNIQARGTTDANSRKTLGEAATRIGLIAEINRMFHDPSHADGVIDADFVEELGARCIEAAGATWRIAFAADIEPIALDQDTFLPVALVLAECINNAIEHGHSDGARGMIRVEIRHAPAGEGVRIAVIDDGGGLPQGFDPEAQRSIGLTLVRSFARQVGGTFAMRNEGGTRSELVFPYAYSDEAAALARIATDLSATRAADAAQAAN